MNFVFVGAPLAAPGIDVLYDSSETKDKRQKQGAASNAPTKHEFKTMQQYDI